MHVGNLVKIRISDSSICNKIGVILALSEPSPMFPYQTATIMLSNGSCIDGIHPSSLEIIDAHAT